MSDRKSGVLCHISSLPSPFGIGDLGPSAYRFVDFLKESGQKLWQILPITPTTSFCEHSPYSGPSAFAGNTLFISPELLMEEGLLEEKDLKKIPVFPPGRIDFARVVDFKNKLLAKAVKNFDQRDLNYQSFLQENRGWLEDYALFMRLKERFPDKGWVHWPPEYRDRDTAALSRLKQEEEKELAKITIAQFLFYKQWSKLKNYSWYQAVEIIGDIPIYVDGDSADVWRFPQQFKLDADKQPRFVAGAPPDYFSKTGQRWGNPVYDWEQLRRSHFDWWIKRVSFNLKIFDWVRIDHFRGFINYWEIPAHEKTAENGHWIWVPTDEFFGTLRQQITDLRIIAEDLGELSDEVKAKIASIGFPGMKVLHFAFDSDMQHNSYLPHNYSENWVVYTGTHDNNTTKGWFEHDISDGVRQNVLNYVGASRETADIPYQLMRLASHSRAKWAIFPMQDVLGLGPEARMNTPSTLKGNWLWRLKAEEISPELAERLAELTRDANR